MNHIKDLDNFINESGHFQKIVKGIKGIKDKITGALKGSPVANALKLKAEGRLPKGVKIILPESPAQPHEHGSVIERLNVTIEEYMGAMLEINEDAGMDYQHHNDRSIISVDVPKLLKIIDQQLVFKNEAPLLVWGPPGVGKTSIIRQVSQKHGLPLYDISLSQTNPDEFFLPTAENGRLKALPTEWLPLYHPNQQDGDKIANTYIDANGVNHGEIGGVIFFDELARASKAVQNVVLKLILDRELQSWKVGSKWIFICASNRIKDDDGDMNFNTTLGNRLQHVNLVLNAEDWGNWAMTAKHKGHYIDPAFIAFLKAHSDYFYQKNPDNMEETIFPSPRTWTEACVSMLQRIALNKRNGEETTTDELEEVIAQHVGAPAAKKFMEFNELVKQFPVDQVEKVYTDPMHAPLPPEVPGNRGASKYKLDVAYALLTTVVLTKRGKTLTPTELNNFVTYVERLDDPTWAQKLMAHLVEIFPDLRNPQTEIGKAMLPHAARFLKKYPGYNPGKLMKADLDKRASQAGPGQQQNP